MTARAPGIGRIQDPPSALVRLLARLRDDPVEYDLAPYLRGLSLVNAAEAELVALDRLWSNHLAVVATLREAIPLARLGGLDPMVAFQRNVSLAFREMLERFEEEVAEQVQGLDASAGEIDGDGLGLRGPSATLSYLVDADPFRHALGLRVGGDLGLSIGAALHWPPYLLVATAHRWFGSRRSPEGG